MWLVRIWGFQGIHHHRRGPKGRGPTAFGALGPLGPWRWSMGPRGQLALGQTWFRETAAGRLFPAFLEIKNPGNLVKIRIFGDFQGF